MFETMISSQVRTLFAYIVVSYANCNSGEEEMQYAQREQAYIEPFGFWKDFEKRNPSGREHWLMIFSKECFDAYCMLEFVAFEYPWIR